MTNNINKPNHYIGTYGLEVKDVTRNFIKGKAEMEAHRWCSAVEYLLRYKEKNGLEDLKKARKNLSDLAIKLGYHRDTIAKWEAGSSISKHAKEDICTFFWNGGV